MSLYRIDDIDLPTPDSELSYEEEDTQENAYRDGNWVLHKTTIRWGLRSRTLKWNSLTDSQMNLIRSLAKPGTKEYFKFSYWEDTGQIVNINEVYSGNLKRTLEKVVDGVGYWKDVSLSFIER